MSFSINFQKMTGQIRLNTYIVRMKTVKCTKKDQSPLHTPPPQRQVMKKSYILLFSLLATLTSYSFPNAASSKLETSKLPAAKQTSLGKYLSSNAAYKLLQDNDSVLFIDVRDSVEIGLSGHPANIDAIVPLKIQTTRYNDTLFEFELTPNVQFVEELEQVLELNGKTKDDMIILTCGSGIRSAMAVNVLAKANYTNVWHIPDGYEGDEKPGINTKNAWQLAGLPWSDELVHGSHWRLAVESE